jgi:asparagine synthase (glutamine-hydrolysing)
MVEGGKSIMCGINGIYSFNIKNKEFLVKEMNNLLIHRGPDNEGLFSNSNITLGMRRLSIIDLNNGNQPLFNKDKNKCIVFNGEIYNYKELKSELINNGVEFSTNSDTEVILQSYIRWGENCLDKFRGMFAFAIYDLVNDELFIARDAFGEKPLYFTNFKSNFIFSSEIRPILSTNLIPKKINHQSMEIYFQLGYVPSPHSMIENIQKLPAGYFLKYKNNQLKLFRWYDHYEIKPVDEYKNFNLKDLIENSIKQCLVSDVPVGVFLSGGLDSSIVTYYSSKNLNQKLSSFSLGFSNKDFDESKRASYASRSFNTSHNLTFMNDKEIRNELNLIISKMDEPISDASFISTYIISKFTSRKLKVVLTGDGGDEIFGGYEKYLIHTYSNIYNSLPLIIKSILTFIFKYIINPRSTVYSKYIKLLENAKLTPNDRVLNTMILNFKPSELETLLLNKSNINKSLNSIRNDLNRLLISNDIVTTSLLLDQTYTLEGCMLQKVDRASMLNSIETRSPLLNIDLVRYANTLKSSDKISFLTKKKILKKEYKNIIPSKILNYKKKGFSIPINYLITENVLSSFNLFFEKTFIENQGLFDYTYVTKLKNDFLTQKKYYLSNKIWTYLVFQNWYKINLS